MGGWLRKLQKGGRPVGPAETVRRFGAEEQPLTRSRVVQDGDAWRIEAHEEGSVALFEVPEPGVEGCVLSYRASLRTVDASGVYLEMWCRLPGRGEFFSKGLHRVLTGTRDWSSEEITFLLKKGQRPDLVKLNVAFGAGGTLWMKDIELLQTPLR